MKGLACNPDDRYATALAFADDLRCWLRGLPVSARHHSVGEKLTKWIRRHPAIAALIMLSSIVVAGLGTLIVGGWSYAALQQSHEATLKEKSRADENNRKLQLENERGNRLLVRASAERSPLQRDKVLADEAGVRAETRSNSRRASHCMRPICSRSTSEIVEGKISLALRLLDKNRETPTGTGCQASNGTTCGATVDSPIDDRASRNPALHFCLAINRSGRFRRWHSGPLRQHDRPAVRRSRPVCHSRPTASTKSFRITVASSVFDLQLESWS